MGYYSWVTGSIKMSEDCFKAMMEVRVHLPSFSEPLTLNDYFEEISYRDACCTVDSYAKHYDLAQILKILASFKEGETPDEIVYQGESGIEDSGVYFILPGRWAYLNVQYPGIDDVRESDWVNAADLNNEEVKHHATEQ